MNKALVAAALVLLVLSSLPATRQAFASSTLLAGDFEFMKVDQANHLLFLSDKAQNSVVVVNATNEREFKSLFVGSAPEGLDISADGQELYVALSGAQSLAVVDIHTLTVSRTISLTISPGCVATGRQGRAYATAANSGAWHYPVIIDTNSSRQIASIKSGGEMADGDLCATSPDGNTLYVAEGQIEPSTTYRFSVSTDNATLLGKTDFSSNPEFIKDIAVSPDGSRIYLAAGWPYYIDIRNATSLTKAGELQTGPYPNSVTTSPDGKVVFASHSSGTIVEFNATTMLRIGNFSAGAAVIMMRDYNASAIYVIVGDNTGTTRYLELVPTETTPPKWPPGSSLRAVRVTDGSVSLAWDAAVGGLRLTGYQLYENGSVVASPSSNTTQFTMNALKPDSHYEFTVQAIGASGELTADGPSLVVKTLPDRTPPAGPLLVGPVDGIIVNSTTPFFRWSPDMDPSGVTYNIEVDDTPYFSSPEVNASGLVGNYYRSPSLSFGTHYWRVRAMDGAGNVGNFSGITSFSVFSMSTTGSTASSSGEFSLSDVAIGVGITIAGIAIALAIRSRPVVAAPLGKTAAVPTPAPPPSQGQQVSVGTPTELRLGEVLSRVSNLYVANFSKYIPVFLLTGLVSGVLEYFEEQQVLPLISQPSTAPPFDALSALIQFLVVILLISWLVGSLGTAMGVGITAEGIQTGRGTFRGAARALKKMHWVYLAGFLVGLAEFFGFFLLVVPAIILALMFSLTIPVIVIEEAGPLEGMQRSRELVGQRWLKTFALLLVVGIFVGLPNLAFSFIGSLVGEYGVILSNALGAFTLPLYPIALTVYYYSNEARLSPPLAAPASFGSCFNCGEPIVSASQRYCTKCGHALPLP